MKPEHFIYKPDGLYYIPNIPEGYFYTNDPVGLKKALERAKAEAVKVDDDSSRLEIGFRISKAYDLGKNQSELSKIYTINMEEKIEVYDMELTSCEHCISCQLIPNCTTLAARIAAPKKEEESESQMEMLYELLSNYREHLQDRKNGSNKPLDDFMAEELEKFEIKRKPLNFITE